MDPVEKGEIYNAYNIQSGQKEEEGNYKERWLHSSRTQNQIKRLWAVFLFFYSHDDMKC